MDLTPDDTTDDTVFPSTPPKSQDIEKIFSFLKDCNDFLTAEMFKTLEKLFLLSVSKDTSSREYLAQRVTAHPDIFPKLWYALAANFKSNFTESASNSDEKKKGGIFSKGRKLKALLKKGKLITHAVLCSTFSAWPSDKRIQATLVCGLFLMCFLNITDYSEEVCRAFGQHGFLDMMLAGLEADALPDDLKDNVVAMIYNCCRRVPENRVLCKGEISTLQDLTTSTDREIQADAFLALSYIVNKAESHKLALTKSCIKFLLGALKKALDSSDRTGEGYSVEEITQGIQQLAMNDSNKRIIAELGGIALMERILVGHRSTEEEKGFAAQGIWQLAFVEENKITIRRRNSLMKGNEFPIPGIAFYYSHVV